MAEPVNLQDLLAAFASSLVATRRHLDQANVALDAIYASQEMLRELARPSFEIEEVTIDVPFVIESVKPPAPVVPKIPLRRNVRFTERELASLLRGVSDPTVAEFRDFTHAYAALKQQHTAVRSRAADGAGIQLQPPRIEPLAPKALTELRRGASRASLEKLDRLIEDLDAARSDLAAANEAVLAGADRQVLVRADPEALASAPEAARNHITLKIRGRSSDAVEVDGSSLLLPE
ncbi:MAG TPA: hypothetical protein VLA56_15580 [Pseudomonadales bacterium]|nr:hypothetical protein [Pseudomonadales bacterium]